MARVCTRLTQEGLMFAPGSELPPLPGFGRRLCHAGRTPHPAGQGRSPHGQHPPQEFASVHLAYSFARTHLAPPRPMSHPVSRPGLFLHGLQYRLTESTDVLHGPGRDNRAVPLYIGARTDGAELVL